MNQIGKSRSSSLEQVSDSIHQAVDQLSQAARPAVSRVASGAHEMVDRLASSSSRAAQHLQETGTRLKDGGQQLVRTGKGYVTEHPFRSLGIVVAAGVLLSFIAQKSLGHDKDSAENG